MSRLYIAYRPITPAPIVTYEPETTRYLNAIGVPNNGTVYFGSTAYEITGAEVWTAVDELVIQIKLVYLLTLGVDNLYTISRFIFLRFGGDATMNRYNLVTGTADGTYVGGWTHDGSGSLPNGTTGYMTTVFGYDGNSFEQNTQSFTISIKTDTSGVKADFGVIDGGFANVLQYTRNGSNFTTRLVDQINNTGTNTNSTGRYFISRNSSSQYKQYKNGTSFNTVTQTSDSFTNSTPKILIEGAVNNGGTAIQFSDRKRTYFAHFDGADDTQVASLDSAFDNFDTTLGR